MDILYKNIRNILVNTNNILEVFEDENSIAITVANTTDDCEAITNLKDKANLFTEKDKELYTFSIKKTVKKYNLKLNKREDGDYITVNMYSSPNVLMFYDYQEDNFKLSFKKRELGTLSLHKDEIFAKNFKTDGYYPATLRNLSFVDKKVSEEICSYYSKNIHIYKDFAKDNFYPPLKITELNKFHNKKEYFQSQFPKVTYPNSINKYNNKKAYCIGCASKYINPEQVHLLFQKEYQPAISENTSYFSKHNQKNLAYTYIYDIFRQKLGENTVRNYNIEIADYVWMAIEYKELIDIKQGIKKIIEKHNELTIKERVKVLKQKNKPFKIANTPLEKLKMPKEFKKITTLKGLANESSSQDNCVVSYAKKVEKGTSAIYSATINGERLTIEIIYTKSKGKTKFSVNQCLKSNNKKCKKETLEYVKNCLTKSEEKYAKNL